MLIIEFGLKIIIKHKNYINYIKWFVYLAAYHTNYYYYYGFFNYVSESIRGVLNKIKIGSVVFETVINSDMSLVDV